MLVGLCVALAGLAMPAVTWAGSGVASDRGVAVEVPAPDVLARLIPRQHPRVLATRQDFDRLKQLVAAQELPKRWHRQLRQRAQRILREPPSRYGLSDGVRMLDVSERVLERVYILALLHWLDGDRRYVKRAWDELHAAAQFPNWNPRHFLDTAEMTHAFAIGYDWLYHEWTADQRDVLRQAIIKHGLKPARFAYQEPATFGWWVQVSHNWNQVCNGGIALGALALGEEFPEVAGTLLASALESLRRPMSRFAPDGGWDEGPFYWNYATYYNVLFLASLEKALGTDFGLSQASGFESTGLFPLYMSGPTGRTFNYADRDDGRLRSPQLFWMANKFGRPIYAWYQRESALPTALDLLWFDSRGESPQQSHLPLDKYFRSLEAATFRSAWEDRDALFIGFKGGDNLANHAHLDLGTFVLDAQGERWAMDLGLDDYNLPGYFGQQRWTYYRLRAEGHNTLVINPDAQPDQDRAAKARLIRVSSNPARAFAIADLTAAYVQHASKVWRGIALESRQRAIVQDEIQAETPAEVWWFMHTPARIELHDRGRTAMLFQNGARLKASLLTPPEAVFSVMEAAPLATSPRPPRQSSNKNVRKLAIHLSKVKDLRLTVLMEPMVPRKKLRLDPPVVTALEDWKEMSGN
jgi:hypothetical protein